MSRLLNEQLYLIYSTQISTLLVIPSGPGAFPTFSFLMASLISSMVISGQAWDSGELTDCAFWWVLGGEDSSWVLAT